MFSYFYHFLVSDSKFFSRPKQRCHHSIGRMSVNACASVAFAISNLKVLLVNLSKRLIKHIIHHEQRRALAFLKLAVVRRRHQIFAFHILYEQIIDLDSFLLYPRRGDVNFIVQSNTDSSPGTGYPTQIVHLLA